MRVTLMVIYLRTSFCRNGYAHATRIRPKPSRRRSSWSKPHLVGYPVCGLIRVDFQYPTTNRVTEKAAANGRPRPAEKLVIISICKWNRVG